EAAAARLATGGIGVRIVPARVDGGVSTPAQAALVRFLAEESGRAAQTVPFGTEMGQFAALGAEGCVFGPGDIRVAHRTGEFVPLAELEAAERILARAIERFTA